MYSAKITRLNPTAFIFLIDRSGSMEEHMNLGDSVMTKADAVAMVTNMLTRELINRCRREDGIADYFDIAAIGYSGAGAEILLGGKDGFTRPSALAMESVPKRTFTRERVLPGGNTVLATETLNYWIQPEASGDTPMGMALEKVLELTSRWCRRPANTESYPPTIFNITDGEASDADSGKLIALASEIKSLGTSDGKTLLININLRSGKGNGSVIFPSSPRELPDSRYTKMLYDMSSVMPAEYSAQISELKGAQHGPPYRALGFNASLTDLIAMMEIGSRSMNSMQ